MLAFYKTPDLGFYSQNKLNTQLSEDGINYKTLGTIENGMSADDYNFTNENLLSYK
jgi:retron-type reverse transcriptase